MNDPSISCYLIALKFEVKGTAGTIPLPSGPGFVTEFSTKDTEKPNSKFLETFLPRQSISNNIQEIIDYASVFPGKNDLARDRLYRQVLTSGEYTLEAFKVECDDTFVPVKDSVNDDPPVPQTPSDDNTGDDLANPEEKCHSTAFIIVVDQGGSSTEITVNLKSSRDPLPDPIDRERRTKDEILAYINFYDASRADDVSKAINDGNVISITWSGKFWKLCAEEKETNEDDTEDELVKSPRYEISRVLGEYLNKAPSDPDETVEYEVNYNDDSIVDDTIGAFFIKTILNQKSFNKNTFLYPRATDDPVNLNIKGFTLIPGRTAITVAGWENAMAPKIAIYSTNPNDLPDSITIDMNIDVILKFNVPYSINVGWQEFKADFISYTDTYPRVELFYSHEEGKDGKGIDFSILNPIIIDYSAYAYVGGIITNPPTPDPGYTLLNKKDIDFHLEGDSFEITLKKHRPRKNLSGKYLADYMAENFVQIGKDQLKLALEKNKNKIANSILEGCDTQGAVKYAEKAIDTARDILLNRGKQAVPLSQHKCTEIIYYRADFTFGPEYDIAVKFLKP